MCLAYNFAMCVFAESLNCDGVKKRTKYSLAQAWNMGMGKWARQPSSSWIRRNKTKIVIKLNGLFVVDDSSWSHGVCSYMHLMVLAYVNGPCGSIGRSFVKRPHRWLYATNCFSLLRYKCRIDLWKMMIWQPNCLFERAKEHNSLLWNLTTHTVWDEFGSFIK